MSINVLFIEDAENAEAKLTSLQNNVKLLFKSLE